MSEISIVVSTCDRYSKLLNGYIHFFEKNFDYSRIESVYIGLENLSVDDYSIFNFVTTSEGDWSIRLYKTLTMVKSEYILLMLDDYWSLDKIDVKILNYLSDFVIKNHVDHLSSVINPMDYMHQLELNDSMSVCEVYSVTPNKSMDYYYVAGGFYKRESLMKLLRKNESAWDFESNATRRGVRNGLTKNFRYYSKKNVFGYPFGGIIHKGHLTSVSDIRLKQLGYDFSWEPLSVNVSTPETPILTRSFRKLKRVSIRLFNRFFGRI